MSEVIDSKRESDSVELSGEEIFIQGKKFYIIGDYSKALEYLSKACKILESKNGHLSDEMFEPYYYLGKGYYMYIKEDTELLNNGVEVEKEENEEEKTSEENKEDKKDEKEDSNENDESDDIEETAEPSKREDLTYLQLAYETIECAKLILERRLEASTETNQKDIELKLADCCDIVGNIYMEECVIAEAIGEFTRALDLRVKNGSDISIERSIAESHFNLAMAYCIDSNPQSAIRDYAKCKAILETCKKRALDENDEKTANELTEIIADINDRIVDCEEGERDYKLAKESIKELLGLKTSSDLPVTDVSHLVRRKNAVAEEPPAKRLKESDGSSQ